MSIRLRFRKIINYNIIHITPIPIIRTPYVYRSSPIPKICYILILPQYLPLRKTIKCPKEIRSTIFLLIILCISFLNAVQAMHTLMASMLKLSRLCSLHLLMVFFNRLEGVLLLHVLAGAGFCSVFVIVDFLLVCCCCVLD